MTTPILTNEKASRSLTEFEFVYDSKDRPSKLGKGSFANVRLVQEKKTGKLFALKMINVNSTRISRSELHNLRTEIQIHRQLDHPNIIKFDGYIQEGLNIYLVLDYAQNGNLYTYLHKKKVLTPNEVFHFFYQSCLAIQYIHEKDFVHRDIKPENLLLDKDLNIKVCDFGWSAKSIKEKRITFCGTYEYMAPEIVRKKPYDYRVDIWSLGVLLYELIHREAPYKGRNLPEILNSLSNTTLTFCESVQPEVKHLIQSILKIDPNERSSISDILNHPWIKYHLHKKDYTHQNPISAFLTPTKPTNREPQVEEQDQDLYISQDLIPPQEQMTDEPYPSIFEIPVQQVSARKVKNSPAIQIPTLPIHSNKLREGSYGFHQASPRAISQLNSPPPSKILKDHEYENAPFTPVKPMNFNEDFYSNKNYGFSSATLPKKVAENWAAFDSRKMSNDPGSRKLFEKDIMSPDFNLKLNSILGQLNGNAASAKKEGASEASILSARYHSNQPKQTNYEGSISFRGYDMPAARENSIGSRQIEQRERERERENLHNATSDYSNNTSIDNCNKVKFNSENSKAALRPVSNNHAVNTALQARADPSQNVYVPTFKINFVSTKYQQNSSNSSFHKHTTFDLNKSAQKAMMENSMHRRNPNVCAFDEMVNSLCKSARVENKPGYDGYLIQSSNLNDVQRKLVFKVSNNNTPLKESPAPLSERGIDRNKENLTGSAGDRKQVMYDRLYTQR